RRAGHHGTAARRRRTQYFCQPLVAHFSSITDLGTRQVGPVADPARHVPVTRQGSTPPGRRSGRPLTRLSPTGPNVGADEGNTHHGPHPPPDPRRLLLSAGHGRPRRLRRAQLTRVVLV